MTSTTPSKPTLWKECKALGITFNESYASLKVSDLQTALNTRNDSITKTPTASPSTPTMKARKCKTLSDEDLRLLELKEQARIAKRLAAETKARTTIERAKLAQSSIEKEYEIAATKEAKRLADKVIREERLATARARKEELESVKTQEITESSANIEDIEIDLLDTKEVEVAGKSFRCQNQRYMLTYKTHLDKELVATFFGDKNAKEVITAHEKASSETNYEHSHVFVDFGRVFQSLNARIFDISGIHPHINAIKSAKHLEHTWAYLCKEDTENEYLLARLTTKTLFDKVASCKTVQEAMRLAKTPGDATGLATLFAFRQLEKPEPKPLTHEWQIELFEELQRAPHPRKIIWYYDASGNAGKTTFSNHITDSNMGLCLAQFGGDRDAGQLIAGAIENGWDGKILIADLPRQGEHRSIYSPLESIKNGNVTNTKYRGNILRFNVPHVVVMSNFLPRVHEMSLDRWDIRELTSSGEWPDKKVTVRHLPLAEAVTRSTAHSGARETLDALTRSVSSYEDKKTMLQALLDHTRFALASL